MIPRLSLPEAIIEGQGHGLSARTRHRSRASSCRSTIPKPGHSPVQMLYKYGGSIFRPCREPNRLGEACTARDNLEFVVNQSIWNEGEATFADIILPACTNFERWDISEWSNLGGYVPSWPDAAQPPRHHAPAQVHRAAGRIEVRLRHLHRDLSKRLGLGAYFSEGMSELDWVKRMFDASDLPDAHHLEASSSRRAITSCPAGARTARAPVAYRWFYEGRKKDMPEPHPAAVATTRTNSARGCRRQSGKFEFECETLKRFATPTTRSGRRSSNTCRPGRGIHADAWRAIRCS